MTTTIAVSGKGGSGKTTLGKALSKKTRIKFVELDNIWFEENRNREVFTKRVLTKVIPKSKWILDGKYRTVREKIIEEAENERVEGKEGPISVKPIFNRLRKENFIGT